MIANRKKHSLLWLIKNNLYVARIAVDLFRSTNDKRFYDYAKWFIDTNEELKREIMAYE